ncbi:hypothetical protein L1987_04708 [Smallanthus sonchifolius]|uniref:Uncharacterized protein n=1 Tax=Smallanthus sonchifolius TaxID=185202 RepID=A0ACB9JTA6_9ASTR|nr:hypothetical protein L1987_04708 [Smallanthus sonchifolius]
MEMEFMAEFTEGMSRDRARQTIKGKRTKRQRPSSPFGMSTTSASASGNSDCLIDNFAPDQSPAMSSEISTKEDEDMANCLIMLAQSVSPVKEEEKSDQIRQKTEKLSSRRFTEMKSGFYVYECKTCNRTFPSFQALGGHRASHKKPKANVEEKKSISINIPPPVTEYVEEVHDQYKAVEGDEENKASRIITINNNNNSKGKVHECSICGSEFLSGQALGGHMRKHRPVPPSVNRTVISMNTADETIEKSPAGSGSMLSLDLNFPPPEFQFTASSSQQHLVFSAPTFVDCHY